MLRLFLLRHAKSDWADPGRDDRDRPLAARGQSDARLVAARLGTWPAPDLVLCSPARRCRETLEHVLAAWSPVPEVRIDERLYEAQVETLLAVATETPASASSLLVVGHNPTMQEAAITLAVGPPETLARMREKYPAGGLGVLTLEGPWSALEPGTASVEAFVTPKSLRPQ